ncbi:MAG: hypothetical protein FWE98_08545 [Oscillospiraceae bacterium]|nr:hypothetical protein [Oscillospiraceae bacterium]
MKLIATQEIVADGVTYKPGTELPQSDLHRVAAWKKNGAAKLVGDVPAKKANKPKTDAKPPAKPGAKPPAKQPAKPPSVAGGGAAEQDPVEPKAEEEKEPEQG